MKRIISLALVLAMLFTAMLGIIPAAEGSAAVTLPEELSGVRIESAQLVFASTVYFKIQIYCRYLDGDGVQGGEHRQKLGLNITDKKGNVTELTYDDKSDESVYRIVFNVKVGGAKNIGDELKLEMTYDGTVFGEAKSISIFELGLLSKKAAPKDESDKNVALHALIDEMNNYAAAAQDAFGYTGDYDLDVDKTYTNAVKLKGGATFEDGSTFKAFAEGDTATVSNEYITENVVWYNSNYNVAGSGATLTVAQSTLESVSDFIYAAPGTRPFGSALPSDDVTAITGSTNAIGLRAAILGVIGDYAAGDDTAESVMTITMKFAYNSAATGQLMLRDSTYANNNGGSKTGVIVASNNRNGRFALIFFKSGKIASRYNTNGEATSTGKDIADITNGADASTYGESKTVNIVIDAKNKTMTYYVDGTAVHTATVGPNLDYYKAGSTIFLRANDVSGVKLEEFVVTAGDFTSYNK